MICDEMLHVLSNSAKVQKCGIQEALDLDLDQECTAWDNLMSRF